VLRAAEVTETKQGNIQDLLQLDERDFEFQLPTDRQIAALTVFCNLHQHYVYNQILNLYN
jgi:hypothetical protein